MYAKKKIKTKKPPLSWLDCFIYCVLFMFGIIFAFVCDDLCAGFFMRIVLAESSAIAYWKGNSSLCFLPLILVITLSICLPAGYGLKAKQPIFGNRRFKTIGFQPMLKVYPIFSKAFRENLTVQGRERIRKRLRIWLICFIVSMLIMPWGLYPRETLDKHNCFTRYNSFNQVIDTHHIDEAEKLYIGIRTSRSYRTASVSRYIRLRFEFEDHTYTLEVDCNILEYDDCFREMDREAELEYLLYLKSFFKNGRYELSDLDKVDYVAGAPVFSDREAKLVYELFDYTGE